MAETNWRDEAKSDAKSAADHFVDEIVEGFIEDEGGEQNTDITDWSDSYHHESHVDKSYNLLEAAHLLDDLDEFEETDSGLWDGQMPRDAISTQAAYTYGNAVSSMFSDLMKEINEAVENALDVELFFDFEECIQFSKRRLPQTGPFEWLPEVEDFNDLSEEQKEELEKEHEKDIKEKVKEIVSRTIDGY